MVTTATELFNSNPERGDRPVNWCIHFYATDCSTAQILREAEEGKRHWIEKITVTSVTTGKWVKILNGDDDLIGPLPSGVMWTHGFKYGVELLKGNAIKIKTPEAFNVLIIIEGYTEAYPVVAFNPLPTDNATNVNVNTTLLWSVSPQIQEVKVYFGEGSAVYAGTQSGTTYNPGPLTNSTTYVWRIDSVFDGNVITGNEWTFITS